MRKQKKNKIKQFILYVLAHIMFIGIFLYGFMHITVYR